MTKDCQLLLVKCFFNSLPIVNLLIFLLDRLVLPSYYKPKAWLLLHRLRGGCKRVISVSLFKST